MTNAILVPSNDINDFENEPKRYWVNSNIKSCTKNFEGYYHSFNDKPAIEYENGAKEWYHRGKLHRENGPAIINCDGDGFYFLYNRLYDLAEWCNSVNISLEEKAELVLKYGK